MTLLEYHSLSLINNLLKGVQLVISNSEFQSKYKQCILAVITSAKQSNWEDDVIITNICETGLTASSKIRLKIFTLESNLIINRLGYLNNQDKQSISSKIQKYL